MPRLLYYFNAIPTFKPQSFFKELDKHISTFIWNKKVPRLRRSFLEKSKSEGGLALPNFLHYYWAANIHKVVFWMSTFRDGVLGPTGAAWSGGLVAQLIPLHYFALHYHSAGDATQITPLLASPFAYGHSLRSILGSDTW